MRIKRERVYRLSIIILFIALIIILFHFFIQPIFLQSPPAGTSTVSNVGGFSTTQDAVLTSADLAQQVYAFDGVSGFAADLFNNDGLEEVYYYNGDRFGIVGPNNENLLYLDGRGLTSFRKGAALVFRIDDGSNDENKYIVVKSSQAGCSQTPCPTWYAHRALGVYALNSFNGYSAGQQIALLPYTDFPICDIDSQGICMRESPAGCICSQSYVYWITSNEVILKSNQPLFVVASDRDFQTIGSYKLLLETDGTIRFTLAGEVGNPVYPQFQPFCYSGTSTTPTPVNTAHRGNAMFQTELCRTDSNGVCTGMKDVYLFNNDFFRINADGSLIQVGSWHDYDCQIISIIQGGQFTFYIPYGGTFAHVDSVFVFNAGTDTIPDYRMIIMWDSDGARIVSGKISIDPQGVFSFIPLWATIGGSVSGNAAQQLALGYVKGLPGGPHIVNGRYAFDAITGQLLADMDLAVVSSTNLFAFTDPRFWPTTPQGSYVIDRNSGFEAQPYQSTNILAHVLPVVESLSTPISSTAPFQLIFRDVGSNLPLGPAPTGNADQGGIIRNANLYADYNFQTNSISFKLLKFRNQQHASILQAYDETPFVIGVTQAHKDLALKFIQQPSISDRGFDEWAFNKELQLLSACTVTNGGVEICDGLDNNCNGQIDEGLGSTTCGIGICQRTIQNCVDGISQLCSPGLPNPSGEICTNSLDDDCNGIINNGCTLNAPSNLIATPS